jgi:hypothetical protein
MRPSFPSDAKEDPHQILVADLESGTKSVQTQKKGAPKPSGALRPSAALKIRFSAPKAIQIQFIDYFC